MSHFVQQSVLFCFVCLFDCFLFVCLLGCLFVCPQLSGWKLYGYSQGRRQGELLGEANGTWGSRAELTLFTVIIVTKALTQHVFLSFKLSSFTVSYVHNSEGLLNVCIRCDELIKRDDFLVYHCYLNLIFIYTLSSFYNFTLGKFSTF